MANILIIYSTTDGHTLKICQALQSVIESNKHHVKLMAIEHSKAIVLNDFDKIIIGARIRYGKHSPLVYDFIKRNKRTLKNKSNAFFSVNAVARKPEKSKPATNPYIKIFLKKSDWKPNQMGVFGGKIDYQKYKFWDRQMIRFIMWMTNGPTDLKTVAEFTNWAEVEAFGQQICVF